MKTKPLSLAWIILSLLLGGCQTNPFNGQWTLEVRPEEASSPECFNSFLGIDERLYFVLAQDNGALTGYPISFPGANAAQDQNATWKVLWEASDDQIDIYIWIADSAAPGGCGDVNRFTGLLNGDTVEGTYQGGDCNSYSVADTPSGRVVIQEVTGGPVVSCTWSGTFTMTRSK